MAHFDIAIIGTGSGNSILDERYADKRVAICEQGTFGGTCLNVGCIPTKMFVYAAEVAATRAVIRRDTASTPTSTACGGATSSRRVFGRIDPIAAGRRELPALVPERRGVRQPHAVRPTQPDGRYALRTDDGDEFTADQVVIAAGSRAVVPDAIAECGVPYHTSDTIMRIAGCCPST